MKTAFVLFACVAVALSQSADSRVLQFNADFASTIKMSMGGMPGASGLPGPGASGMPGMSGMPGISGMPAMSGFPMLRSKAYDSVPYLAGIAAQNDAHLAAANPDARFESQQMDISIVTSMTGMIKYDFPNGRQRLDIKTFEVKATGIPMPNSGVQTLTGDNFMIYRYDLGKNFTKVEGQTKGCECNNLEGEIDSYFLPPGTQQLADEPITIGKDTFTAKKYNIKLTLGVGMPGAADGAASVVDMTFWVRPVANPYVAKVSSVFSMMGQTISEEMTFANWNSSPNTDAKIFKPDGCSCPEVPKAPAPPADASTKATASCSANKPPSGCTCLSTTEVANLKYCGKYVNYAIDKVIDPASLDMFVETAVSAAELAGGSCPGLQEFMCKFYFMVCLENKELFHPESPPTCKAFTSSSAAAAYDSGIPKASGNSSNANTLGYSLVVLLISVLVLGMF